MGYEKTVWRKTVILKICNNRFHFRVHPMFITTSLVKPS